MAHTPGPWEVDGFTDCQLITKDVPPAIGQPIGIGKVYGDNQIANARLIAAAPDLLEALVDLTRIAAAINLTVPKDMPDHLAERINAARAAIAKALGQ